MGWTDGSVGSDWSLPTVIFDGELVYRKCRSTQLVPAIVAPIPGFNGNDRFVFHTVFCNAPLRLDGRTYSVGIVADDSASDDKVQVFHSELDSIRNSMMDFQNSLHFMPRGVVLPQDHMNALHARAAMWPDLHMSPADQKFRSEHYLRSKFAAAVQNAPVSRIDEVSDQRKVTGRTRAKLPSRKGRHTQSPPPPFSFPPR